MKYYYRAATHSDGCASINIPVALYRTNGSSEADYWDKVHLEWRFDEWFLWNLWGMGGNTVPYVEITEKRAKEIITEWSTVSKP